MHFINRLIDGIELKLQETPKGLSEFELIHAMREEGVLPIERDALSNHLGLFRVHFMVFHCLYRLRDQLLSDQAGWLEIDALKIRILPYFSEREGLQKQDPLREYYLDLSQLTDTTESDVDDLLNSFWKQFSDGPAILATGDREQALETLGLEDPVDKVTIKKRFRILAMEHHPDRGGCEDRLKEINHAMRVLMA